MRTTDARIGVVGATGVVGAVTLELLAERGFSDVRAYASSRSAGSDVGYGGGSLRVEEATPERLAADGLDLCFFSVGTGPSSGWFRRQRKQVRRASTSRMPSGSLKESRSLSRG